MRRPKDDRVVMQVPLLQLTVFEVDFADGLHYSLLITGGGVQELARYRTRERARRALRCAFAVYEELVRQPDGNLAPEELATRLREGLAARLESKK